MAHLHVSFLVVFPSGTEYLEEERAEATAHNQVDDEVGGGVEDQHQVEGDDEVSALYWREAEYVRREPADGADNEIADIWQLADEEHGDHWDQQQRGADLPVLAAPGRDAAVYPLRPV